MNPQDLTFADNLLITGYRNIAYSLGGGAVFSLANVMLLGAVSLAGMAVAFPIAVGVALSIGAVWNYVLNPQGSAVLLIGGVLLVLVAVVTDARSPTPS